jgi:hypothetical protein
MFSSRGSFMVGVEFWVPIVVILLIQLAMISRGRGGGGGGVGRDLSSVKLLRGLTVRLE